jgi:hypothetical protein
MVAAARGIHRRSRFEVTESLRRRFEAGLDKSNTTGCWLWKAGQRNGYGAIKHQTKVLSAHVVAWVIENGEVPEGKIITHTCDVKLCCRVHVDHVQLGTPLSNAREMYARLTTHQARGELVPTAKLTDAKVRFILAANILNGAGRRRLSKVLGQSESIINDVLRRKNWTHIEIPSREEAEQIVEQFTATLT